MLRSDVSFRSGDVSCAAWLYMPDTPATAVRPIVVMAHGLAGVKEQRLDAFAERFAAVGYACLVFDYRHFGASGGEPRQLLDIARQLEDWEAAVAHARTLAGIDPERVVVWGTSFGGGHAIVTAARDHRLAAAIAQCPFTDGLASMRAIPPMTSAKVTALALRDVAAAVTGRDRVLVPSYGPPGAAALMTSPDSAAGVEALNAPGASVPSDVAARFALDIIRHFPGRQAKNVACPILFVICEHDAVAPPKPTWRYARQAPRGETTSFEAGHFDIYVGDWFERNVSEQLEFLARHVPVGG